VMQQVARDESYRDKTCKLQGLAYGRKEMHDTLLFISYLHKFTDARWKCCKLEV
jgi:hypothetical protein